MRVDVMRDAFSELFAGRDEAYGTVEGGAVKEPLTREVYAAHLEEPGRSIGVYPLVVFSGAQGAAWARDHNGLDGGAFMVRWGCTDIDNKADPESCYPLARNMHKALAALGVAAWIERTKGKGYHVWVFAQEWVPAVVMRRALLVAHQIAGVAPTEVNPKQVDVAKLKVGLGNYVNLPYAHDWLDTDRRTMIALDDGGSMPLEWFLDHAWGQRTSFDTLYAAAKLYKEPPKKHVNIGEPSGEAADIARHLPGLAFTIWRDGVLDGRDRSGTLMRLAYLCAEAELTPADALVVLYDADQRWGKYHDRGDVDQLDGMIERAYG